jgi:type IV pilus assembly protein PilP
MMRGQRHAPNARAALLALAAAAALAGCTGGVEDLDAWLAEEKAKPGGGIEGLPQPKLFETFSYEAQELRSPFSPESGPAAQALAQAAAQASGGMSPDFNRNREFLEEYPLDALRMVGTLELRGVLYGLVRDSDGGVHRVRVGNYLGQNHGRIAEINDGEIRLSEIVLDTKGVWVSRDASLVLQ